MHETNVFCFDTTLTQTQIMITALALRSVAQVNSNQIDLQLLLELDAKESVDGLGIPKFALPQSSCDHVVCLR